MFGKITSMCKGFFRSEDNIQNNGRDAYFGLGTRDLTSFQVPHATCAWPEVFCDPEYQLVNSGEAEAALNNASANILAGSSMPDGYMNGLKKIADILGEDRVRLYNDGLIAALSG